MTGRTLIPDGDNQTRLSQRNRESFELGLGDSSTVDGAPVVIFDNNRVTFHNRGSAITTGDTATVEINGNRGTVNNVSRGEILAEQTGIDITGRHAVVNNDGAIAGGFNGVSFANGGLSSGILNNDGTISSDSRAVNIGGNGVVVFNQGHILGTGDQRNGTIYTDGSADNYAIVNGFQGVIDAGEHNQGAGIALQTGNVQGDVVRALLLNSGTIQGRGQADAGSNLAGDGIRIFSGVEGGGTFFRGNLVNRGEILSESTQGATSAVRISDGVGFQGTILNTSDGLIDGAQNGLYFGDGEHRATVRNFGTIQSGSRAVNIDGSGVTLRNEGNILGTGNQRNGTVYADATAENYAIINERRGVIDAGELNQGAGISLQTGDVAGDIVLGSVFNAGTIQGRGAADPNTNLAGDGIRFFTTVAAGTTFLGNIENQGEISGTDDGIDIQTGVTLLGDINNQGAIAADDVGIRITGSLSGDIHNQGLLNGGVAAIDATVANGPITVNNTGIIYGDVLLSQFNDTVDSRQGQLNGRLVGEAGNDELIGGQTADTIVGGLGDDTLTGGSNADTFVFSPVDIGADIVTDFQDGLDVLDVSAFSFGVTDLQAVIDGAQQIGQDALLTFADNNSVSLQNTQVDLIDATDFVV